MHILMLTNAMASGGAETHILTLTACLIRRGHRVTVASAGGAMVGALTACGARHVRLPLDRRDALSLLRARRGLERLLRQEPWDIVHAHARLPAFLVSSLAERFGLCFVTTVHAKFSAGALARRFSRWGRASVAVCEELRDHVCRHFSVNVSDVSVIGNGVDTVRFSPPAKGRTVGTHVLCMSRLDPDCARGAMLLCRIAPRLYEKFPDLSVTIVGGGGAYAAVAREAERATARCGVPIRMVGGVADPAPLLRDCDVFLGVSRGAMEAMACGRSVVLGGDEGFFGLLDGDDLDGAAAYNFCARGCAPMTEDKLFAALCEALSENGSQRAARQYAMRRYAEERLDAAGMADATEGWYRHVRRQMPRGGSEILLCGYYGFGNAGDEALLRAAIGRARARFGDRGLAVLMKDKRGTRRGGVIFGLGIVSRRRPLSVWRAIGRARVLVFGGGTLLQDLTSRRSLWYYTALLRAAQKRGVACELWGNGLGPFFGRGSEARVAACLRGCESVGLRDRQSLALARSLMGDRGARAVYEGDLALRSAPSEPSRIAYLWQTLGLREDGHYVLVAPKKSGEGLARMLESALRKEIGQGRTLLVAALYPKEDARVCRRLCRRLGGIYVGGLDAPDLVGLAARCEHVYGMRLHALIFAASAHTPFTAIGTDPKLTAFLEDAGRQ